MSTSTGGFDPSIEDEARALIGTIRANRDEYLHGAAHKLADITERLLGGQRAPTLAPIPWNVIRRWLMNAVRLDRRQLPDREFHARLDAMAADIEKNRQPLGAASSGVSPSEKFRPAQVFHPSEYIAEEAMERGWDLWELVRRGGVPEKEWPVTVLSWRLYAAAGSAEDLKGCYMGTDGANQLGKAFGMDGAFWLALESYWMANSDRHTPMTDPKLHAFYYPDDEESTAPGVSPLPTEPTEKP